MRVSPVNTDAAVYLVSMNTCSSSCWQCMQHAEAPGREVLRCLWSTVCRARCMQVCPGKGWIPGPQNHQGLAAGPPCSAPLTRVLFSASCQKEDSAECPGRRRECGRNTPWLESCCLYPLCFPAIGQVRSHGHAHHKCRKEAESHDDRQEAQPSVET